MPETSEFNNSKELRPVQPKSYTLAELWELMKVHVKELEKKSGQYQTMTRLELSAFHEWLKRREGEGGR